MSVRRAAAIAVLALGCGVLIPPASANAGRQSAAQKAARAERVGKALAVVRDPELQKADPDRVSKAIQELGESGEVAVIPDLIKLLRFRIWWPWERDPNAPKDLSMPISRGMRYPAVNALKGIGPACLPAVMEVIETHDSKSVESQNAMEVIIYLSRYDRPKYVRDLEERASSAGSPVAKRRLLTAAETLKETKR